jgi:hypothetical protein
MLMVYIFFRGWNPEESMLLLLLLEVLVNHFRVIYIYKLFMKTTEKMENNVFIKVESFYNINNKIVEQI